MKRSKQSLGGLAVIPKTPPDECTHDGCNQTMKDRTWHSFLGHLGLHGLADKYFNGDMHAAQERLRENGRARTDPARYNGAWKPYRPIDED